MEDGLKSPDQKLTRGVPTEAYKQTLSPDTEKTLTCEQIYKMFETVSICIQYSVQ